MSALAERRLPATRSQPDEEVPLLDGATHHSAAATMTRSARHPLGRLIGDWLVLEPSASGRGRSRRVPFDAEHGVHVGGAHHIALLDHPLTYDRLRGWLGATRELHPARPRRRTSWRPLDERPLRRPRASAFPPFPHLIRP
jgi:hypothetical protein